MAVPFKANRPGPCAGVTGGAVGSPLPRFHLKWHCQPSGVTGRPGLGGTKRREQPGAHFARPPTRMGTGPRDGDDPRFLQIGDGEGKGMIPAILANRGSHDRMGMGMTLANRGWDPHPRRRINRGDGDGDGDFAPRACRSLLATTRLAALPSESPDCAHPGHDSTAARAASAPRTGRVAGPQRAADSVSSEAIAPGPPSHPSQAIKPL
jgi:hypothetical protein